MGLLEKRVNEFVEEYSRHYMTASQGNLVDLLDVAQFYYNLHKSIATCLSLIEIAMGQQPLSHNVIAN